jgi:hypothetical protein
MIRNPRGLSTQPLKKEFSGDRGPEARWSNSAVTSLASSACDRIKTRRREPGFLLPRTTVIGSKLDWLLASKGNAKVGTEYPGFRFRRSVHTARGLPAIYRGRGRAFIVLPAMRSSGPFPCNRQPYSSLKGQPASLRDGAPYPRLSGHRRPDGGGDQRLRFAQSRRRCRHIGALAWSCPRGLLTRQAQRS